jgi:hypothetical protein
MGDTGVTRFPDGVRWCPRCELHFRVLMVPTCLLCGTMLEPARRRFPSPAAFAGPMDRPSVAEPPALGRCNGWFTMLLIVAVILFGGPVLWLMVAALGSG